MTAFDSPALPPERRAGTVRRVLAFFRPYRVSVTLVVGMILVTSLLGLINPWLLGQLIDVGIPTKDWVLINVFVALMIVVPIVNGVIGVGQSYLSTTVGQSVMLDLRNALYEHLQGMPFRFFSETRTGEIQSRLANDVGGIQTVVTDTASSTVSSVATVVSTIAFMLFLNWQLTLISLGILPVFVALTYRVGKVRRAVSAETQKSLADVSAIAEETLSVSGILLSKTFGQQRAMVERFRAENRRLFRLQVRQAMVGRWFGMVIGTVFSITPALVYWFAGWLIINRQQGITVGEIVVFTTLQSRLFFPLGSLLNLQVEIQGALALFDRIIQYLDLPQTIRDAPHAIELDPGTVRGEVRLEHVSFAYPPGQMLAMEPPGTAGEANGEARYAVDSAATARAGPERPDVRGPLAAADIDEIETDALEAEAATPEALGADAPAAVDLLVEAKAVPRSVEELTPEPAATQPFGLVDIDFEALPGELVALVGPSGAGKSTTTYLIPRLYDVDAGRVSIDGHDVRDVGLESLGRAIGFVTQETHLFHTTIAENLRYGRPDATDADLEAAARAAAIHDRIMELPDGYRTVVGERGYRLSGGEKQRIAIARVLLKDPRVLILDEATSALDTVSERLIQGALERLMENRTTVAIAHRLSTILAADRILVFERGRIVERGTHAELVANGGLYARLYREQFLGAVEVAGGVPAT